MALSIKQIKACQLIAKGVPPKTVQRELEISAATLYRWEATEAFSECFSFFQSQELERSLAQTLPTTDPDELEQSLNDEIEAREQLKLLAINVCTITNTLTRRVLEEGCYDLSPRAIPSLVSAATAAVACLRESNDRLSGLEEILNELTKIDQEISVKGQQFLSTKKD